MSDPEVRIDNIDTMILKMLLTDARTSQKEISDRCGISPNAVFKRIERLRSKGVIVGSVTLFTPKFLDERYAASLELTIDHSKKKDITNAIQQHPNVLMCFEGVGKCDIFALIGAKCVGELDAVKDEIRAINGIKKMAIVVRVDEFEFIFNNLDLGETGAEKHG